MDNQTTYVKRPITTPATPQQLDNYARQGAELAAALPTPSTRFQFIAAFDGTWNDRSNRSLSRTEYQTNVASIEDMVRANKNPGVLSKYYPGVGTDGFASRHLSASIGPQQEILTKAAAAYADLAIQADEWQKANPGQPLDISVSMVAFSRGAGSALLFAQLLNERGIPDLNSAYKVEVTETRGEETIVRQETRYSKNLIEPGQVPVQAMLLYDPVLTGVKVPPGLPPNVRHAAVFIAEDEHRSVFPATEFSNPKQPDPRISVYRRAGAHTDIGGGYDQGLGLLNLKDGLAYLRSRGVNAAELDPSHQPDPSKMVINNSSVGLFAGDWVEQRPVCKLWQPERFRLPSSRAYPDISEITPLGDGRFVRSNISGAGEHSAQVLDQNRQVLLETKPGQQLLRDPETGAFTVLDGQGRTVASLGATPGTENATDTDNSTPHTPQSNKREHDNTADILDSEQNPWLAAYLRGKASVSERAAAPEAATPEPANSVGGPKFKF